MFNGGTGAGPGGAGPPVRTSSRSHNAQASRLAEPSLSRWTPNPVSLPPRIAHQQHNSHSHHAPPYSQPSQVPTVPPRNSSCSNGVSDNWVDLEELYRWLQELEDTKIEPREEPPSDEDNTGKRHTDFGT